MSSCREVYHEIVAAWCAGVKQLKWESQRDDWIHDRDAKTLRRKKAAFNKRKSFGRGVKTTAVMMGNKRKRK